MARNKYPEETIKLILDVATKLFLEKGYENTSLQDIILKANSSKGAIYHHFRSKEEIFETICKRIGEENSIALAKIRDSKDLNGQEKLKSIFKSALFSSNQKIMLNVTPNLLENPKFLAIQIRQMYEIVAPQFIEPIIREGITDGSIKTEHPKEVAEVIMILNNIWLNPLVYSNSMETLKNRYLVYNRLLNGLGVDLFNDEMIEELFKHYSTNICS